MFAKLEQNAVKEHEATSLNCGGVVQYFYGLTAISTVSDLNFSLQINKC